LINKCLEGLRQEYPKMPYYITGGGISYIKGAKDYISKMLGVNVTLIAPNDIHMQKPHYSSILGLLNTALNQDLKLSFVEKLLQKIKRKK
ncbi:MAG: cell division FtsA domain-containing protein, partial [Clostridia bacterium]|nr:cell division FtsA domain-containing protein [Clostridia bacterium]